MKLRIIFILVLFLHTTVAYAAKPASNPGKGNPHNTPSTTWPLAHKDCEPVLVPSGDIERWEQSDLKRYCEIVGSDLYCWGRNDSGQVGNGDTGFCEAVPETEKVEVLSGGVTEVALGASGDFVTRTCAIQNGLPLCWGDNNLGALGNADEPPLEISNRSTPRVASLFGSPASNPRVGGSWTCVTVNGSDSCAGWNGVWLLN